MLRSASGHDVSRGLSLPDPWVRHMVTHLREQATEDSSANGCCGSAHLSYSLSGRHAFRSAFPTLHRPGKGASPYRDATPSQCLLREPA